MKVLMINGSPHEKGCTFTALERMAQVLEERGIETEIFHIGKKPVGGCAACGGCSGKDKCVFEDSVNEALELAKSADGFVFGTPVYYASPNGSMIGFMDRFFRAGDAMLTYKPAAVAASARRGGCSASLEVLMKYPTYAQMPVVTSSYWPLVHGNNREEVLQDAEGMFTMEVMGKNMAWMLRCIEAGKAAGIEPEWEEKEIWTNFIR